MIDPIDAALRAVATHSPLAYPLAFAGGLVTSAGPCTAPRYVAVAALTHASHRPRTVVAAFVAGLAGGFVVVGCAAGTIGALWSASPIAYGALAVLLIAGGVVTLLGAHGGASAHRCDETAGARRAARAGIGAPFLLGASSALVVSPCCTPVAAAIAGLTAASGRIGDAAGLLTAFALGHAAPVIAAGLLGSRLAGQLARWSTAQAPAVISGGLLLALGAYYGVLA